MQIRTTLALAAAALSLGVPVAAADSRRLPAAARRRSLTRSIASWPTAARTAPSPSFGRMPARTRSTATSPTRAGAPPPPWTRSGRRRRLACRAIGALGGGLVDLLLSLPGDVASAVGRSPRQHVARDEETGALTRARVSC